VRNVAKWYCEFRFDGRMRRVPLFTDRKASEDAARQIERLIDCCGAGEAPTAALVRWLEVMPPALRTRLVDMGMVDSRRVAACRALDEHLDDFRKALLAKGTTERHAVLVHSRALRVFTECRFRFWADISAGKVHTYIASLREPTKTTPGLSAQSANFYLAAVKQFCRWAVRDGRAAESPVAHLSGWNVRTDRRHDRRALSLDEVQRLLRAAQGGRDRAGMTGPERAMLYRVALETGLRAGELRSLTRGSFQLDGDDPTVTVAAGYSKRRREDVQPLRPSLAAALAEFLTGKPRAAAAFSVPRRERVASVLRADLAAARAAWVKESRTAKERAAREASDFLAYRDSAGRVADFHALRHTFITNLVAGGVHPKTAQVLARHCTITLTMDRYAHAYRGAEAAALAVLPELGGGTARLRPTGT
jgi:integrase